MGSLVKWKLWFLCCTAHFRKTGFCNNISTLTLHSFTSSSWTSLKWRSVPGPSDQYKSRTQGHLSLQHEDVPHTQFPCSECIIAPGFQCLLLPPQRFLERIPICQQQALRIEPKNLSHDGSYFLLVFFLKVVTITKDIKRYIELFHSKKLELTANKTTNTSIS